MNLAHAEGAMVHYVLDEGPNTGIHRPAVIKGGAEEAVNLMVYLDGPADSVGPCAPETAWRPGVLHDETTKPPGTWHWPETEEPDDEV